MIKDAVHTYRVFHDFDPEDIGEFHPSLKVPRTVSLAGRGIRVLYHSNKWEGGRAWHNYGHDHGRGVFYYRTDRRGKQVAVPEDIYRAKDLALTRLGDCLGFDYEDENGNKIEATTDERKVELYTTPHGLTPCLFVIGEKRWLLAMAWGGKLGIEDAGIVG